MQRRPIEKTSMNALPPHSIAHCPYCAAPILRWSTSSRIEPCHQCKRPMVLIPWPLGSSGSLRLHSLLALATTAYGIAMVTLVAVFVVSEMTPRRFVSVLSVLLFVIGSVLIVDGILSARTRIDVTWHRRRTGKPATLMGLGKAVSGALAMVLTLVGLGL